jgi:hypothetical protein
VINPRQVWLVIGGRKLALRKAEFNCKEDAMDSKEPEIKKSEEINDAPLVEGQLEKVVGGGAVQGTHIKQGYITVRKNTGDQAKEYQ